MESLTAHMMCRKSVLSRRLEFCYNPCLVLSSNTNKAVLLVISITPKLWIRMAGRHSTSLHGKGGILKRIIYEANEHPLRMVHMFLWLS